MHAYFVILLQLSKVMGPLCPGAKSWDLMMPPVLHLVQVSARLPVGVLMQVVSQYSTILCLLHWLPFHFALTFVHLFFPCFVLHAIKMPGTFAVAVRGDGSLVSWGSDLDDDDQPGGQVSGTPPGTDFLKIGAFEFGSMALKTDGTMVVWGSDKYGKQVSAAPQKRLQADH